jgi:type VI secretion system protein ImpB
MPMAEGGQHFISKNRAPRVHIAYEVETFGSRQKVELPFIMGVMSDLSGKSLKEKKPLAERDFIDFDMDNFEQRMEAIAPRAVFQVDNTLTNDGKLSVELNFKSMEDFSPGAVAKNTPALKKLLDVRQELNELLGFMDGKDGAQELLDRVLNDPDLAKALAAAKAESAASAGAATESKDAPA